MPQVLTALLRTLVPTIAGILCEKAVESGITIDNGAVQLVLTGVLTGVYYLLARGVESAFPGIGSVLVGLGAGKGGPVYPNASTPAQR